MGNVSIAIKPKYPTRKALEKVIFNDGNFLTIIPEQSTRQLGSLLQTAYVSIIKDGSYYPVDVDTYEAQFALVEAGSTPTVEKDDNFGTKTLDYFASAIDTSTIAGLNNVQTEVELYNSIIRAKLYKVLDYTKLGIAGITKNGFWFAFNYDLASATSEGYTDVKFFDGTALVNGANYVFLGTDADSVNKYLFTIKATLAVNGESGDVSVAFSTKFTTDVMIEADAVPAIEVDGTEYASLGAAFAALAGKGGTVTINKSVADTTESPIIIEDGKEYNLELVGGAVLSLHAEGYFHLKYGTFNFKGEGTVTESVFDYCVITLNNTDEEKFATVNVAKGVTLIGMYGTILKKNVVATTFNCAGTIESRSNGTDSGAAITVNGNAVDATVNMTGSTAGSVGFGMYIAGPTTTTVSGATIEGTDGGIEQRAGTLVIENSRISTSSTEEPRMEPNGSGTTSYGCAVAIAQHTTKKTIDVAISNTTMIGPAAFMEGNPQQNPTATEDTTINIGEGCAALGLIKTQTPASDCTKFLYGGIYSVKPDDAYVATGYTAKELTNGRYEVVKE